MLGLAVLQVVVVTDQPVVHSVPVSQVYCLMASHGLTLVESETKVPLSTAMLCICFAAKPEQVVMACRWLHLHRKRRELEQVGRHAQVTSAARFDTSACLARWRKIPLTQAVSHSAQAVAASRAYYTPSQQCCKLFLFKGKPAASEQSCDRDVEGWW
jgi:hypothetical protein